MKILMPTTEFPPDPGGVATLSLEEAAGLAAGGMEVWVEAVERGRTGARPAAPPGTQFYYGKVGTGPVWRLAPLTLNLARAVRRFRPDFIHCPTYRGFGLPVLAVASTARIPYSIYLHGTELYSELPRKARHAAMRAVLRGAACVMTNSENTLNLTREAFPFLSSRLTAVLPGAHPERFLDPGLARRGVALRRQWLERLSVPGSPVVMVSLCRIDKQKGVDKILLAFAALLKRRPDLSAIYVAVGAGPDLLEFQQLATKLGLSDKVLFPGPLPYQDTPVALKAADLYVQPSQPVGTFLESFGISFVEAQAAGLPCIGSDWGGVPEAVANGTTAILIKPGDAEGLEGALESLVSDSELRARMGQCGIERAAQMSWSAHARKLAEIIRAHTLPTP